MKENVSESSKGVDVPIRRSQILTVLSHFQIPELRMRVLIQRSM
jgi:hypothetical protein